MNSLRKTTQTKSLWSKGRDEKSFSEYIALGFWFNRKKKKKDYDLTFRQIDYVCTLAHFKYSGKTAKKIIAWIEEMNI